MLFKALIVILGYLWFEELYGIPQIVEAIVGCHIEKMRHHRITKIILIESSATV